MDLIYARSIHEGEQLPNGDYIILHETMTAHMTCLNKSRWGYTTVVGDEPGETCDICNK
jgi:hypothetical protein